jgi:hypothetical protein
VKHQRQSIRIVDAGFDADITLFVESKRNGIGLAFCQRIEQYNQ